jgi:class 3 adenylate cyclase/pimeloyl-ACP methyl ester carboxylesterase
MEVFEEEPGLQRLLDGLRALGRVIMFDRRGLGLSDPVTAWDRTIPDQWADDLEAIFDAVSPRDAVIFAWDSWGVSTRFVARHPDRVTRLVLCEPLISTEEDWQEWAADRLREVQANISGEYDALERLAPSYLSDRSFRKWYQRAGRLGASPATAGRIFESIFCDAPAAQGLSEVAVPTVVLHRTGNRYVPAESVQLVAEQVPNAVLVEMDGVDHFPFMGDVDSVLAEIADFVVGERRLPPPDRLLAVIMFTDLVGSTEQAASLGDAKWKSVLSRHDSATRAAVGRGGGSVVKTTGDGVLALFPSVTSALRSAVRLRDELASDGLDLRIGMHVGDVDRRGDDISGLAVHIAARVMAHAGSGQIGATASVVAAMAGQAAVFEPAGCHELKGVPGQWELYHLAR